MKSNIVIFIFIVIFGGAIGVAIRRDYQDREVRNNVSNYLVEQREGEGYWREYYCKDINIRPDGWIDIVEHTGNKATLSGQIRVKKLK